MTKLVCRFCFGLFLVTSTAWADSSLEKLGLGSIVQYKGLYAGNFGCEMQYKALYGVGGGCGNWSPAIGILSAPFSMDRFLNGMVPIVAVTLVLLVADFRYRRRVRRQQEATSA